MNQDAENSGLKANQVSPKGEKKEKKSEVRTEKYRSNTTKQHPSFPPVNLSLGPHHRTIIPSTDFLKN